VNRRDLYEKAIGYLEDAESIYNEAATPTTTARKKFINSAVRQRKSHINSAGVNGCATPRTFTTSAYLTCGKRYRKRHTRKA
jgi:hypothetical protein